MSGSWPRRLESSASTTDAATYGRLAEAIRTGLERKWLDALDNRYATGSQTANIFALALGVVPEANRQGVLNSLLTDILEKRHGHLHTGNIGTTAIMDALAALGAATFCIAWPRLPTIPVGATWSAKAPLRSGRPGERPGRLYRVQLGRRQHADVGSIEEFFYDDLAGIEGPDYYGSRTVMPGFSDIRLCPHIVGDLTGAEAHVRTHWNSQHFVATKERCVGVNASIPVNTLATVSVPKAGLHSVTVEENGCPVWNDGAFHVGPSGITGAVEEPDCVTFRVGSGSYRFILRGSQ